jgi:signal transduction histidine kinase
MGKTSAFLKRHVLWVGFAAVALPLLLLQYLQYGWLEKLARTSAQAQRNVLHQLLDNLAKDIEEHYRNTASSLLQISARPFLEQDLDQVARFWRQQQNPGVRRLLLVDYTRVKTGNFYVYQPQTGKLQASPASEESLAFVIACLPWQANLTQEKPAGAPDLFVNEQDPKHRLVLRPIYAEQAGPVGIVALILDEQWFKKSFLPKIAAQALSQGLSEGLQDLRLVLKDTDRLPVVGQLPAIGLKADVVMRIPFVFTDWSLSLFNLGMGPEQLAGQGFVYNMAMALLLALLILGGIVLAFQSANKAMRLSQMKSDFVSNVSHELRTPLAAIRVFAEHLVAGRAKTPEKAKEYGAYIDTESRRLSHLIENILDFSRIESRRKHYQMTSCDLAAVIKAVVDTFVAGLKNSASQVKLSLPEPALPQVVVDPYAIGQALYNLLDNAEKYGAREQEIRVMLQAGSFPHAGKDKTEKGFSIVVCDQGPGIAKHEQARIFDRFHRVCGSIAHDVKGSGLGLSIVRHIVEAHGGRAGVESKPGKGSCFYLWLPGTSQEGDV